MSEAPLNPSFRDGPASKPMRVPWWKPALVIVAAAGAFIVLVNLV